MFVLSACVFAETVTDEAAESTNAVEENALPQERGGFGGGRPGSGMRGGQMGEGMQPPQMSNGEMPEGEGIQPPQMPQGDTAAEDTLMPNDRAANKETTNADSSQTQIDSSAMAETEPDFGSGDMQGRFPERMPQQTDDETNQQKQSEKTNTAAGFLKEYSTPVTSIVLLALAFVFVKFYKRKTY